MKSKTGLLLLLAFFAFDFAQGKLIKFSVDLTGYVPDSFGVHITGDFQTLAGYAGGDWQPGTTEMFNEAGTEIYSVVVNIPAFRHYEFKFINGIFGYQVEFVPLPSRVNEMSNDNRWIYLDSLDNDTMTFGAIRFSGNAPMGKDLLRFKVDMQQVANVDTINGVHVSGLWQGFDPAITRMYSFDGIVYEYIAYLDSLTGGNESLWRFANGNTTGDYENVPVACQAINGNRGMTVINDTVLSVVCFSECAACVPAAITSPAHAANPIAVYPVPATETVTFELTAPQSSVSFQGCRITDTQGRIVFQVNEIHNASLTFARNGLSPGLYFAQFVNEHGEAQSVKFIFE